MFVKFKYQVFYNESTGYSVCQYKSSDLEKTVTCTGFNLPTTKNITYEFEAEEQTSGKYKGSYNVISYKEHINKTKEDIVEYLSCGLFAGISKKTAEKIFAAFGEDTLRILDEDIESLGKVPGIGKKTLDKITLSYEENRASRLIAEKLIKYGVSVSSCNRIHRVFKADALRIIDEDPYRLCMIRGITFPVADMIAKDKGFSDTDYSRVQAASDYVLMQDMITGNVCMPKIDYAMAMINTLASPKITKSNILTYILRLMKDGTIAYNKRILLTGKEEYFYHPSTYRAERSIATYVKDLLAERKKAIINIDKLIAKYEKKFAITLDETQKKAVKIGVTEPIYIITGGPGTGKTTILKIIASINEELNGGEDNNIFLSPTGRAARRITESTGYPARTIHSALHIGMRENDSVDMSEEVTEKLLTDAKVIVDEASMIDLWIMDCLMKNLDNSSLGLIGDIDQLPSVRCGSILRDLIACEIVPCVQLTKIHRQSDDAANICENARRIKNGFPHLATGNDFEIVKADSLEEAEKRIASATMEMIAKYGEENVKVLCPFKKGFNGVYRMNNILQEKLNPHKGGRTLKIANDMEIREGDPVMQLKNIEEVSNGDVGYVMCITEKDLTVRFTDEKHTIVDYSYQDAKEQLILAYATTVHKSQGSEYDAVVMCLTKMHGMMLRRNILYTGITRGKHKVILIGSEAAFAKAVENNMIEDRHSMLPELINPKSDKIRKELEEIKKAKEPTYEQMKLPFVENF